MVNITRIYRTIRYKMIQDYIGLFWTIQDQTEQYRPIQDHARLYRTI